MIDNFGNVSKRKGVVLLYNPFYVSIFILGCLAFILTSLVPSLKGFKVVVGEHILNCFLTTLHMLHNFSLRLIRLVEPKYLGNVDISKMLPFDSGFTGGCYDGVWSCRIRRWVYA